VCIFDCGVTTQSSEESIVTKGNVRDGNMVGARKKPNPLAQLNEGFKGRVPGTRRKAPLIPPRSGKRFTNSRAERGNLGGKNQKDKGRGVPDHNWQNHMKSPERQKGPRETRKKRWKRKGAS